MSGGGVVDLPQDGSQQRGPPSRETSLFIHSIEDMRARLSMGGTGAVSLNARALAASPRGSLSGAAQQGFRAASLARRSLDPDHDFRRVSQSSNASSNLNHQGSSINALAAKQATLQTRRPAVAGDGRRFLSSARSKLSESGTLPAALQPSSTTTPPDSARRAAGVRFPIEEAETTGGEARRHVDGQRLSILHTLDDDDDPLTGVSATLTANKTWRTNVLGIKGSVETHQKRLKERAEIHAALTAWTEEVMTTRAPYVFKQGLGDELEHIDAEQLELEERLTDASMKPDARGMGAQLRAYWNATVQQEVELRFNMMREKWDAEMAGDMEELRELRDQVKSLRKEAKEYKDQYTSLSIKYELLARQAKSSTNQMHAQQQAAEAAAKAAAEAAAAAEARAQAATAEAIAAQAAAAQATASAAKHEAETTSAKFLEGASMDMISGELNRLKGLLSEANQAKKELQAQVDGLTATVAQLEGDKASVTKQMEKHKSEVAVLDFKLREAREEAQKAAADANYARRMSSSGGTQGGGAAGRQRVSSAGGGGSGSGAAAVSPPRDAAPAKGRPGSGKVAANSKSGAKASGGKSSSSAAPAPAAAGGRSKSPETIREEEEEGEGGWEQPEKKRSTSAVAPATPSSPSHLSLLVPPTPTAAPPSPLIPPTPGGTGGPSKAELLKLQKEVDRLGLENQKLNKLLEAKTAEIAKINNEVKELRARSPARGAKTGAGTSSHDAPLSPSHKGKKAPQPQSQSHGQALSEVEASVQAAGPSTDALRTRPDPAAAARAAKAEADLQVTQARIADLEAQLTTVTHDLKAAQELLAKPPPPPSQLEVQLEVERTKRLRLLGGMQDMLGSQLDGLMRDASGGPAISAAAVVQAVDAARAAMKTLLDEFGAGLDVVQQVAPRGTARQSSHAHRHGRHSMAIDKDDLQGLLINSHAKLAQLRELRPTGGHEPGRSAAAGVASPAPPVPEGPAALAQPLAQPRGYAQRLNHWIKAAMAALKPPTRPPLPDTVPLPASLTAAGGAGTSSAGLPLVDQPSTSAGAGDGSAAPLAPAPHTPMLLQRLSAPTITLDQEEQQRLEAAGAHATQHAPAAYGRSSAGHLLAVPESEDSHSSGIHAGTSTSQSLAAASLPPLRLLGALLPGGVHLDVSLSPSGRMSVMGNESATLDRLTHNQQLLATSPSRLARGSASRVVRDTDGQMMSDAGLGGWGSQAHIPAASVDGQAQFPNDEIWQYMQQQERQHQAHASNTLLPSSAAAPYGSGQRYTGAFVLPEAGAAGTTGRGSAAGPVQVTTVDSSNQYTRGGRPQSAALPGRSQLITHVAHQRRGGAFERLHASYMAPPSAGATTGDAGSQQGTPTGMTAAGGRQAGGRPLSAAPGSHQQLSPRDTARSLAPAEALPAEVFGISSYEVLHGRSLSTASPPRSGTSPPCDTAAADGSTAGHSRGGTGSPGQWSSQALAQAEERAMSQVEGAVSREGRGPMSASAAAAAADAMWRPISAPPPSVVAKRTAAGSAPPRSPRIDRTQDSSPPPSLPQPLVAQMQAGGPPPVIKHNIYTGQPAHIASGGFRVRMITANPQKGINLPGGPGSRPHSAAHGRGGGDTASPRDTGPLSLGLNLEPGQGPPQVPPAPAPLLMSEVVGYTAGLSVPMHGITLQPAGPGPASPPHAPAGNLLHVPGQERRVLSGPELMTRNELLSLVRSLQAQTDDMRKKYTAAIEEVSRTEHVREELATEVIEARKHWVAENAYNAMLQEELERMQAILEVITQTASEIVGLPPDALSSPKPRPGSPSGRLGSPTGSRLGSAGRGSPGGSGSHNSTSASHADAVGSTPVLSLPSRLQRSHLGPGAGPEGDTSGSGDTAGAAQSGEQQEPTLGDGAELGAQVSEGTSLLAGVDVAAAAGGGASSAPGAGDASSSAPPDQRQRQRQQQDEEAGIIELGNDDGEDDEEEFPGGSSPLPPQLLRQITTLQHMRDHVLAMQESHAEEVEAQAQALGLPSPKRSPSRAAAASGRIRAPWADDPHADAPTAPEDNRTKAHVTADGLGSSGRMGVTGLHAASGQHTLPLPDHVVVVPTTSPSGRIKFVDAQPDVRQSGSQL